MTSRAGGSRGWREVWLAIGLAGCGFNVDDPLISEPVVTLEEPPPAIHGGTLLATRDGRYAALADPDRHRVVVVELDTQVVRELPLERGLELGRLAEDGAGIVYVSARRGGAIIAIDPRTATEVGRHHVCAAPRGLAWEGSTDQLHVACADGSLVTLGPDRDVVRRLHVAPDLRDVVVTEEGVLATRFRRADTFRVDERGVVSPAEQLPVASLSSQTHSSLVQRYQPNTAVRVVPYERGALVVHQRARVGPQAVLRVDPVTTTTTTTHSHDDSYSSTPATRTTTTTTTTEGRVFTWEDPCGNAVAHVAVTALDASGRHRSVSWPVQRGVTPVDVAVSPRGHVAVAFAGGTGSAFTRGPQVLSTAVGDVLRGEPGLGCLSGDAQRGYPGQVVAVAFAGERLLAQIRSPAQLVIDRSTVIELGGQSVVDTGHDLFHLDLGGTISCATCHPGGGDDGHVWHLTGAGPVRTQTLEGMVGQAPYHRAGDIPTFSELMSNLQRQMDGPVLDAERIAAAERWQASLPPPPAGPRADATEPGRAIFDAEGCASCHGGELGTDRELYTVGTSRRLLTPLLAGIALRPPYLHDGRADTLGAALLSHGGVEHLTPAEQEDLVRYLESR